LTPRDGNPLVFELSNLVNEKVSVFIEMAYRLSRAFGSTAETILDCA
jgi:plasmid maintenance system antidote protein VapI